ncbi:MAG: polyphosphate kinase 1 [Verrucomicrobiales bacterium]
MNFDPDSISEACPDTGQTPPLPVKTPEKSSSVAAPGPDPETKSPYQDRDLSWLSFNERVLWEARDQSLPLYDRLKFLAIFSSNLDEFFRVRVASIRSLLELDKQARKNLGIKAKALLKEIHRTVLAQQAEFGRIYQNEILPELQSRGIYLHNAVLADKNHRAYLQNFFREEVLPFVHPNLLQKGRIIHFLRDKALYLAVRMHPRSKSGEHKSGPSRDKRICYALVQIPTHYCPRFLELPGNGIRHDLVFLDDVIRTHLQEVLPGYVIKDAYSIKLSRDADLQIEDEFTGDLSEKISQSLAKRRVGAPARFLYDKAMPGSMLKYLKEAFQLSDEDAMEGGRYHNFSDFFDLPNPLAPALQSPAMQRLPHPAFDHDLSMFGPIARQDRLLHFPYQRYDYVLRFLNEAALDPAVEEIKTTQYRVASNSGIVSALIRAARNGKKVTVFVELKARFDEAANLQSAADMKAAGVRVIHSLPGLKVHAKIALIMRREEGLSRGYAFLSTGNFNEKTARIYADHGLMTSNQNLTKELEQVFGFLENHQYLPPPFQHLLVAQFNMKSRFLAMIDREIDHAKAGRKSRIIIKINNLEERVMIDKLIEAGRAGVRVDLIIRGICCLRPGIPDLTENIRIRRLVGQHLEHARVFIFHNDGAEEIYLASADWMGRNLNRRVEVGFPVLDPGNKAEIRQVISLQLKDNEKAVRLDANLRNRPIVRPPGAPVVNAQKDLYALIAEGKLGK